MGILTAGTGQCQQCYRLKGIKFTDLALGHGLVVFTQTFLHVQWQVCLTTLYNSFSVPRGQRGGGGCEPRPQHHPGRVSRAMRFGEEKLHSSCLW